MLQKNWNPGDLFDLTNAAQGFCVLKAAVDLDLFTLLDRDDIDGLTIPEIARLTGCNLRALEMLATALLAFNLLEHRDDRLIANEPAKRFLSTKSDEYYGFIIKHVGDIFPDWTRLTDSVKSGLPARLTMTDENEEERENFLKGMFNVARRQAASVADTLDLSGREHLLDLGGGPGTYAIYFCRKYPQLKAVVFDLPTSEKIARNNIESYGLAGRVSFYGGNYLKDELPRNYDVIWVSQVLHGEGPENCRKLIQKASQSLNPGGILAVQEFILDEDRQGPAASALFALNMLVETEEGQAYTESEITNMLEAADCVNIKRIQAPAAPPHCGIIYGYKK